MQEDMTKIPAFMLGQLSQLIEGELIGDPNFQLEGFAPDPLKAKSSELCFIFTKKYIDLLNQGKILPGACIAPSDAKITVNIPRIIVKKPKLVIKQLLDLFAPKRFSFPKGIHPTAVIDENVELGEGVRIGAHVYIGTGAKIGNNTEIQAGSVIGKKVSIGSKCLIRARVVIEDFCKLGNRVIVHPGAVIGADGFSYVTEKDTPIELLQKNPALILDDNFPEKVKQMDLSENPNLKVASAGNVEIGDDVEIGANTCIDRGTLGATTIGKGTKIDNLVQIAHNCKIGEDCLLVGQCGIAGSAVLGDRTVIAGHAGCRDGIEIAHDSLLMAASHAHKDACAYSFIGGNPAISPKEYVKKEKQVRTAIRELEKLKSELELIKQKIS